MFGKDEIKRRFGYHPPSTTEVADAHGEVRRAVALCAEVFDRVLPEGREKSVAFHELENAMMWGNKAIATNPANVAANAEKEAHSG